MAEAEMPLLWLAESEDVRPDCAMVGSGLSPGSRLAARCSSEAGTEGCLNSGDGPDTGSGVCRDAEREPPYSPHRHRSLRRPCQSPHRSKDMAAHRLANLRLEDPIAGSRGYSPRGQRKRETVKEMHSIHHRRLQRRPSPRESLNQCG
jgi:hypothetical protein